MGGESQKHTKEYRDQQRNVCVSRISKDRRETDPGSRSGRERRR